MCLMLAATLPLVYWKDTNSTSNKTAELKYIQLLALVGVGKAKKSVGDNCSQN